MAVRQDWLLLIAALAIALAAGCAKKPDDAAIVTNIQSQFFAEAELKGSDLHVTSANGEVTLTGTATSDVAHLTAYKIATQAPGVRKVTDQIRVENVLGNQAGTSAPPSISVKATPGPEETKRERKGKAKKASRDTAASAVKAPPAAAPEPETVAQNVAQNAPQQAQSTAPQLPAQPQPAAAPVQPAPPPPPEPRDVQVPADTTLTIRMIDSVDSSVNKAGEIFHAALEVPMVVQNEVVVSRGADVYVRLVSAESAGHLSGKSELHLELVKMDFQGRSYQLVSSTYSVAGDSRGKNTAKKVGAGAVLGAIIGGIAGGGKGAAIGATVGGGGGAIYNGVTRGKQVKIPAETKLDFQLEAPVVVSVIPRVKAGSAPLPAQ
jgi:BON domain